MSRGEILNITHISEDSKGKPYNNDCYLESHHGSHAMWEHANKDLHHTVYLKHKWNLHLCNFYRRQAKLQSVWITIEMTGFHRTIINVPAPLKGKSFFPKWREVILVDLKVQPHLPLPSETSQANSSHLNRNSSNRVLCEGGKETFPM